MSYAKLKERFHRIRAVGNARGMLHWDMATMMPDGGAAARTEQLAALGEIEHELCVDPRVADWLAEAEAKPPEDAWDRANLHEMRRQHTHASALSADLVEALTRATSRCEMHWRTARPANDFKGLLPDLEEVLRLVREVGARRSEALGVPVYDALMDEYEPGARAEDIDRLFEELAGFLPNFLEEVLAHQAREGAPLPIEGPFPVERQQDLCRRLMGVVGFDFDHGRLDVSHHPFCGGVPDDVRITTRYAEDDFIQSVMGVLHECGHGMYERGLPAAWRMQPVGSARGMTLHESQSLLLEMQACRSPAFIRFLVPLVQETFGGKGEAWSTANLTRHYREVRRGLIRVDADEVTYPAHVILRYRLERRMVAGELALVDLPDAWNEGMQELLGVVPSNHSKGCLQDIHWPSGGWGYFPTYTLGAMSAAQLFAALRRDVEDVDAHLERGDFQPLVAWLGQHVHSKGSLLTTDELLTEATGAPLGTAAFQAHLRERYLS